jgi:hypothetical protein
VVAAYASMDLVEHLLPLLAGNVFLQNPRRTSLLEVVPNHGVRLRARVHAAPPSHQRGGFLV